METITYKPLVVTAFILAMATVANAQVTKQEQSALTPDKVLSDLMAGNARFAVGNIGDLEIKKRIANTADGQYPKAVVLSCLDSRVPVTPGKMTAWPGRLGRSAGAISSDWSKDVHGWA